jgi:hypothetical protein
VPSARAGSSRLSHGSSDPGLHGGIFAAQVCPVHR